MVGFPRTDRGQLPITTGNYKGVPSVPLVGRDGFPYVKEVRRCLGVNKSCDTRTSRVTEEQHPSR